MRAASTRRSLSGKLDGVAPEQIDDYLAQLDEPKRSSLLALRQAIASIVPDMEEGIAYGSPASG